MPIKKHVAADIPDGYEQLKGSERRPAANARLLGPADPEETFPVTIIVRRRPDGPPMPDFDYFAKTPLSQRRRMPLDEFGSKYGALPQDLRKVADFARSHKLKVVETHAARRTVVVSGTVAQMNEAFGVTLGRYQREITRSRKGKPETETYRGRDGFIHIPTDLTKIIVGVFGLDNRRVAKLQGTGNPGDPSSISALSLQTVTKLYNFPTNSAAGQTIGIFSAAGYFPTDLQAFFGSSLPTVTPIEVNAGNLYFEAQSQGITSTSSTSIALSSTSGILEGWFVSGPQFQSSSSPPTVTGVTPTGVTVSVPLSNPLASGVNVYFYGTYDSGENTQDICISAGAAPGANAAVYFNKADEFGWVATIQRVIHPSPGDPICSVFSCSYVLSGGDDPATLVAWGVSTSFVDVLHAAFQDAALQGVTMCMSSGDTGSNSQAGKYVTSQNPLTYGGDGMAHVSYPTSDPWVLSVGGTTLGGNTANSPPPWVEFVWNDPNPTDPFQWGTTGGGVSDYFALPTYQTNAGVPTNINLTINPNSSFNATGRGVPDVAANASILSGYEMTYFGNPWVGNGTSASAPLWAGLIALLNANLGFNIGFVNPILYVLGSSVFNPINALNPALPQLSGCPTNNGNNGIPGYPAGPGWDACTGWGSPNGTALLAALQQHLAQDCYFIVDQPLFGEAAIAAVIATSTAVPPSAVFQEAFFVVVEGFTPTQLNITSTTLMDPNPSSEAGLVLPIAQTSPSTGVSFALTSVQVVDPSNLNIAQRITYAYNVVFTAGFPAAGPIPVVATVTASGKTVSASTTLQLVDQPSPFLAGGSGISYLSSDVRVFQVEPNELILPYPPPTQGAKYGTGIPLYNTGNPSLDATTFIQSVITAFNLPNSPGTAIPPGLDSNPGGPVPSWFDLISPGENELDLVATNPANNNNPVYNFAVARVRYVSAGLAAQNVRAFFRLIPALNVSTTFDPTTTYRRWTAGPNAIPLYGIDTSGDVISIPCFATPRVNAAIASVESQLDPPNIQTIPAIGGEADVYFGCWLDINQSTVQYPLNVAGMTPDGPFPPGSLQTIQTLLRGEHQCLVVELAYDPDPIPVGSSPSTSGPLAQLNLSLGDVANPGDGGSRRLPNTFMIRPTPVSLAPNQQADELMIDWGDVPVGSTASIYWPAVSAAEVLRLAALMYTTHRLTMPDSHTLRTPVGGITYIPIPPGPGTTLVGLISIDLPLGIQKGQNFDVVVRQVTNVLQAAQRGQEAEPLKWRRVLGSFQMTIQVKTKAVMLEPEEQSLSLMRWIQQSIPTANRWYPVFQRYVAQIAERVSALGGDPSAIVASPTGDGTPQAPPSGKPCHHKAGMEYRGKVMGLKYDRFGDFEGFLFLTEEGDERYFPSREHEIEELSNRAWVERLVISVFVQPSKPHELVSIVLRRAR